MTFQRARNEEQRGIRRRAILDTAAAMLSEMPVADLSLNELSRRVGLAKSNVLRYFESREAVLLVLLDDFLGTWLAALAQELEAGIDPHAALEERADLLARILSQSLAAQKVMCDLFGAQGGVLEHNVSVEVVKAHKRSSLAKVADMSELLRRHVPELGERAQFFCLLSLLSAGALAAYAPPPASLVAAYAEEPALGALHMEPCDALHSAFAATLLGLLPRK
ncbi:TetR family transcriptional regulator [Altererythrobacter endophyticus]|uniref:TetR family transcriptional regulator n=1 Tax=Altericroceibacterium endophyticum TaxID=1808508 RepID=A0A6I4TA29_9SPHN|nr:TetR family transcriptional regulator [Altericroceibacterium endophyticum]